MTDSKRRRFKIILAIIIILGIFLLLRLSVYCIPFIVAFILSSLIEPLVKFIEKKIKIPRKIGTVFSLLFVIAVLGTILGLIISRLVKEIISVYEQINEIFGSLQLFFEAMLEKFNNFYVSLPQTVIDTVDEYFAEAASNAKAYLAPIIEGLTSFTLSLPQAFIFFIITILATYFMSSDKDTINAFFDRQFPVTWMEKTRSIINKLFGALFGWIRAQLILMTVTFTELTIAFIILEVQNALLLALIIAVVDALPVFGVGTVLIPWGIVNLLMGNYKLGISLLLLYIIVLVVRQLIEPKIVSHQIGVHPLLTLFSMYLGLQLIGIIGMIVGPVLVVVLKTLFTTILNTDHIRKRIKQTMNQYLKPAQKQEEIVKEVIVKKKEV
ncbi:MAG: sporulation integral membrane protein YtvI [Clostridiaceae bacterium]|jgi:sporulation integral membrane protein YtvI|nr:sporulation integral membrane protein YtvI [Clostridiaceae bacterium]